MWLAALAVYVVAIVGRTSFGVAGVMAIDRFHSAASGIALFTAVQVGVYALAQIPTGVAIDRLGPRTMLVAGAVVMGLGQVILGSTTSYSVALVARVLIGLGDATAFLSVMRILPFWFPLHVTPLITQLTAAVGQLGQFISAVPFLALLQFAGWTPAFLTLGVSGVLIALAAAVAVADAPAPIDVDSANDDAGADGAAGAAPIQPAPKAPVRRSVLQPLAKVLKDPVCWFRFFCHWIAMVPIIVFLLLWGVPMMTLGMGLSSAQAGTALTLTTIVQAVAGPVLGVLSQRLGNHRDWGVLAFATLMAGTWLWFLASPTPRGFIAILVVMAVLAISSPVSNYGFDFIRELLDSRVVATGTGLANMGGFTASMLAAQGIGWLLDFSASRSGAPAPASYTWADFRLAWLGLIGVWAIGVAGFFATRRFLQRRKHPRFRVKVE